VFSCSDLLSERKLNSDALSPFEKLSVARLAFELLVGDDNFAAGKHSVNNSSGLLTFVSAVVNIHVMSLDTKCLFFISIEDYDVGVRSNGNRPFLRKQSKHFGGCG